MQLEDSNEAICENESSTFISNLPLDTLRIYVYQPFVRIRHIKLNGLCSISILNALYPPGSIYIFNGQVLDTEKSFLFYNLKNGNKIVLLPPNAQNSNSQYMEKWLSLTSDKESFEKRIDLNIKQNSRRELARIKDLKFQKLELKRKRFNSYIKSRANYQTNLYDSYFSDKKSDLSNSSNYGSDSSERTTLNINFKTNESPSTDPLPILWT